MDLFLLGVSFLSGLLTILAPCVLPLLPVIVGGAAGSKNKWQPLILTASLAISVVLFTLLLKVSTAFLNVPPSVWKLVSGGIVLGFGLVTLFPSVWEKISSGLLGRSQQNLARAGAHPSRWSGVFVGAALGPVFSSCSPTYFVILATVLPVSFGAGLLYLIVYALGLSLMLGLIAFFGQRLTMKLGWAAHPDGLFKKILGLILIFVGVAILTGLDKRLEAKLIDAGFGTTNLEERLLEKHDMPVLNEMPPKDTSNLPDSLEEPTLQSTLPIFGMAPELAGLTNWINSSGYTSMQELRGKVVLVDFWTYSCINCIRTLPYLQSWHEKYADKGLVILGVHAPEFQFEKKIENVQKAVTDFGLTYPVVQDNYFTLWRAYKNRYWPAKYLIDQEGRVRYTHFGEGEYDKTEEAITSLLKAEKKAAVVESTAVDFSQIGTRETYLGLSRRENFVEDSAAVLTNGQWTLVGEWNADEESILSASAGARLMMAFTASKANLVMSGLGEAEVWIDGALATSENAGADVENGRVQLDGERLYNLADFNMDYGLHQIELRFPAGIQLFAWTFG